MMKIVKLLNTIESENELYEFISKYEYLLPDPLSLHVNIRNYVQKLLVLGENLIAYVDNLAVGIICGYINNYESRRAYIQLILVHNEYQNQKVGSSLLENFIQLAREKQMDEIILTYDESNRRAEHFYKNFGFQTSLEFIDRIGKRHLIKRIDR